MIGGAGWFKDGRYFRHVQLNQRCFENSHLFNIYHRGILIFADVIADIYMIYEMMHADQQDLAALSSGTCMTVQAHVIFGANFKI